MMERWIGILSGVLAAQLLLTAALLWPRDAEPGGTEPLLADSVATAAERVEVTAGDGGSVELQRLEGAWMIPGEPGLPADPGKVAALLEALGGQPGWPVARTESARERFAVADDSFERRVVVEAAEGRSQRVYLGTSPGFRQIHARAEDRDAIVRIDFNAYDAPAERGGWLDRTLLQPDTLERVEAAGKVLEPGQDNGWVNAAGEPWPGDTAQQLAAALEDLRVTGIGEALKAPEAPRDQGAPQAPGGAGDDGAQNRSADSPAEDGATEAGEAASLTVRTLTVTDRAGSYSLRFSALDQRHTVASDRYPGVVFSVSGYDHDRVVEALDALAAEAESSSEGEDASFSATPDQSGTTGSGTAAAGPGPKDEELP